ncbi:MAG: hypothetical protein A2X35_05070 [Elusimicrobia bacterium GWA2_61_42]|nr:MAG: hypothetical protein A2X35_05070 [Elusimicrobia bacterium GWA2_61_42]OGR77882.1 MAG: hypothetical protein A2X38_00535 [Elusimicrobia bacterium GWC2_61_25]
MDFIKGLKDRTVFIVGSKKNAGKTTFMNYALNRLRGTACVGALSVGVDGEAQDQVFGSPKPQVRAEKGDLLLCAETSLKHSDLHYEILNVYPFCTAIGRPVLLRALRPGRAEISGPENNSQLGEILADMRRHGAGTVFIDGAVDRITQVAAGTKAAFVYVAKVEPENLDSAAAAIKLLWASASVPLWREGEKCPAPVTRVEGALTPGKVPGKEVKGGTLVIEDLTKVFLSWAQWQELKGRFELRFRAKPDLAAFIVNLYNVTRADFEKKLGSPQLADRVIYNPYELTLN